MSTPHVHSCPECYEHPVCAMDCTIVPDLGMTPDGLPYGHTVECDACGAPDAAKELLEEFTGRLVAEGFDAHQDAELHAALAHVRGLLTTHHERRAKARAELDRAIRELSPTLVFEAPHGSLTLAHLHRGEGR